METANKLKALLSYLFAFAIPTSFVVAFLAFVVKPIVPSEASSADLFAGVLERVPTHHATYVLLSAILGLRACWYLRGVQRVRLELEEQGESSERNKLTDREWWACLDLRRRALALRVRADFILYCGVLALVFGIYFVIFSLPGISDNTSSRIAERLFESEFGRQIDCISDGECAYKMTDRFQLRPPPRERPGHAVTDGVLLQVYELDGKPAESRHFRELSRGEELAVTAFSPDGKAAMVAGGAGSFWLTRDGGESWSPQEPRFGPREGPTAAAISGDGMTAIVGRFDESVSMTTDGGVLWNLQEPGFGPQEWLSAAAISGDGRTAIIGGSEGSVLLTTDGGRSWNLQEPGFGPRVGPTVAAISLDGRTAILGSSEGPVSMTTDGGQSWNPLELDFGSQVWLLTAAISGDGRTAIIGGSKGSVWLMTDGGKSWRRLVPKPATKTFPSLVTLSLDARHAIIVTATTRLSVANPRNPEPLEDLYLLPREGIRSVASSPNGLALIFGGDKGSVWLTTNGGQTWHPKLPDQGPPQPLTVAAISDDGRTAIVVGIGGSVWLTTDGGQKWHREQLDLEPQERPTAAAISESGKIAIVGGSLGSAWTMDVLGDGRSPRKVLSEENGESIVRIWFHSAVNGLDMTTAESTPAGIILAENDSMFVIRKHPEFSTWKSRSILDVRNSMQNDEYLQGSQLFQNISDFLLVTDLTTAPIDVQGEWFAAILNRLTILQAATLAIIFFFVQMMIRRYQYNFRMAAFCESRADAVLVSRRFIGTSHIRFNELVQALAPDSYDFKAPPRSPFDRFQKPRDP